MYLAELCKTLLVRETMTRIAETKRELKDKINELAMH
jgi:hypothetical protein